MTTIICKECKHEFIMPNNRFKLCTICSKNKQRERCKKYKSSNKSSISEYNKKWKKEHSSEVRVYNREYSSSRQKKDLNFKLLKNFRSRLSLELRKQISTKTETTLKLLGLSMTEFVDWMFSNFKADMTLENYGSIWHIDHLIPCSWFNLSCKEDREICFHWTNMRPMYARENIIKSNTCKINEILCQEIMIWHFDKNTSCKALVTKFLEKSRDGSS
jgi:hypothetical protein